MITRLPLWLRKAVVDTVETFVPTVLVLTAIGDPNALMNTLLVALGAAAMSAARRAWPEALVWLKDKMGVLTSSLTLLR